MRKRICLLLPGQGIQKFTLLNNIIDIIPEKIKKRHIYKKIIKDLKSKNKKKLNKTSLVQPLIYLYTNYLFEKKRKEIEKIGDINFIIGNSIGELIALKISDSITEEEGLEILQKRGEIMEDFFKDKKCFVKRWYDKF